MDAPPPIPPPAAEAAVSVASVETDTTGSTTASTTGGTGAAVCTGPTTALPGIIQTGIGWAANPGPASSSVTSGASGATSAIADPSFSYFVADAPTGSSASLTVLGK